MCGLATCWMSTRMFVEGHPPGLLLVFYRLWEQIQSGMSVGGTQQNVGWPWNCPHCFSPASHWLNPSWSWPAKQGKPIFRKVVEVAAKYKQYIGRDHEEKREWLGSQTAYNLAQREAGGVHLFFNSLPGKILPHVSSHQALPEDTVAHFTDTKTNVVCSQ